MKKLLVVLLSLSMLLALAIPAMAEENTDTTVGYSADRIVEITDWSEIPNIRESDNYATNPEAYKVLDKEGLLHLHSIIAAGDNLQGVTIYQVYDIDLGGEELTPFGKRGTPFMGNYDGQGHVIDNVTIVPHNKNATGTTVVEVGFFGYTQGGTIKNVVLGDAVEIDASSLEAGNPDARVGGLVGNTQGTLVDNCLVAATVTGTRYTGGVVGFTDTNKDDVIQNTTFAGTANGLKDSVGGFMGVVGGPKENNTCRFLNCRMAGTVYGKGGTWTGGFAGRCWIPGLKIDGCISNGTVTSDTGYVSPFLSRAIGFAVEVTNCTSYATCSTEGFEPKANETDPDVPKNIGIVSNVAELVLSETETLTPTINDMVTTGSSIAAAGSTDSTYTEITITCTPPTAAEIESVHGVPDIPVDDPTNDPSEDDWGDDWDDDDDETTTANKEENTTAPGTTAAPAEEKKGCGSTVSLLSVLSIAALGGTMMIKRRKEN